MSAWLFDIEFIIKLSNVFYQQYLRELIHPEGHWLSGYVHWSVLYVYKFCVALRFNRQNNLYAALKYLFKLNLFVSL